MSSFSVLSRLQIKAFCDTCALTWGLSSSSFTKYVHREMGQKSPCPSCYRDDHKESWTYSLYLMPHVQAWLAGHLSTVYSGILMVHSNTFSHQVHDINQSINKPGPFPCIFTASCLAGELFSLSFFLCFCVSCSSLCSVVHEPYALVFWSSAAAGLDPTESDIFSGTRNDGSVFLMFVALGSAPYDPSTRWILDLTLLHFCPRLAEGSPLSTCCNFPLA